MTISEHYQVRFVTKEKQFAIPQQVYEIKSQSPVEELNSLVNQLLKSTNDLHQNQSFTFLTNGYLLKENFNEHLEVIEEEGKGESVVEVEYFVQTNAPKPFNSLLNNDWVSSVQSNEKYLLSGCYDGTLNVWNLKDGSHVLTVKAHEAPVKSVRWVPAIESDSSFSSLNLGKSDLLFLSASFDETCILWKWTQTSKTVQKMHVFKGHIRSVDCLDVFGNVFVTGSFDKMIKLWMLTGNENAGDELNTQNHDEDEMVSSNKKARHHEPIVRSPYTTLGGHAEAISDVCWMSKSNHPKQSSTDNLPDLASCSMDNTIRIWDMEAFEEKANLKGSKAFMSMDFSSANGLLITGSCDAFVRLFDPRASEGSIVRAGYSSHSGWITSVSWKSDTLGYHFLSGSFDKSVKQWDVRSTKAPLFDLLGHEEKVLTVDWSNSEFVVSGSSDCHVKIFQSL